MTRSKAPSDCCMNLSNNQEGCRLELPHIEKEMCLWLPFLHTYFYCRAHKKTRSIVERGIGQLKRRFHVLHSEVRLTPLKTCKVILACALLHNICKFRNIDLPDEANAEEPAGIEVIEAEEEMEEGTALTIVHRFRQVMLGRVVITQTVQWPWHLMIKNKESNSSCK